MKRNILVIAMVLVGTILSLNSCKKGENDPFLSLSSRKARLSGEWKLTSAEWTEVGDGDTEIYSFDGTNMTCKEDGDTETYEYSENLLIEKDGTFKNTTEETYNVGVVSSKYTNTVEGIWFFVDGNKELDVADKERVAFQYEKITNSWGDQTDTYTYSGKSNDNVSLILLDQLKKKEIVIKYDYEYINYNSKIYTVSGTKTYTLQ